MKQNKYGVFLTRDNVDVNEWMTRSSTLEALGNSALSGYNSAVGVTSLVYVPKNESYGNASFAEPLFMNITKGSYAYSSKTGFIHAVFGADALKSADGYDERHAADYIGCKSFSVTLSDGEAHKTPSDEYGLGEDGYTPFAASEFLTETTYSFDRADVSAVLDGLMSGKKTVIVGEPVRALAAMVCALKALPSAEGANTVSFNTAATKYEAAALSRLSVGSYLKPDAIAQLKADGYYIADINNVRCRDELSSSLARIVYDESDCASFAPDCPPAATGCAEYISAWESAARRYELNAMSMTYSNAKACSEISQTALERYLGLYDASLNDLKRDQYLTVKDNAEACLTTIAQSTLFGKKFAMLGDAQIDELRGFVKELPVPDNSAAIDIAAVCTADKLVGFIKLCYGYAELKDKYGNGGARWLCALFALETATAQSAVKKFIDGLKDNDAILRLVKLLDENSDLFVTNDPYKSGDMLKSKVRALYNSELDRRAAYASIHTRAARNTDWLLSQAYTKILDDADLEMWVKLGTSLTDDNSLATLTANFKAAFKAFVESHPVTERNYEAYRRAAAAFSYDDDSFKQSLARFERSANSQKLFNERLEKNIKSRAAFVEREREFLSRKVKDDNDVEKVLYGTMYKRRRAFDGGYFIWWLAALLIGVAAAGCAVLVKNALDLPWTEFFSTLRHPVGGVPINAILTFVPFVLAISVSMLVYLCSGGKRNSEGKRLMWSALSTLCGVILPYLVFILVCGAMYYFM
ncbi:MAG: hypothetical protein K2O04_03640 [Clostridiales bacterium]|nr:hypothetical protein [Clostridiales bacterium]